MKRLAKLLGLLTLCLLGVIGGRYAFVRTRYPEIVANNELKRVEFSLSYRLAHTDAGKKAIIDRARSYLNDLLPEDIFPAWYGTPWSFNGNAQYPLGGTIACGSFVENVLKNAGFRIDQRMSTQPSEYIIKNICGPNDIARYSNASIQAFNNEVRNMGEGIYLVGLDSHVGFLYIREGSYKFVHSHGCLCVISEFPSLSPTLRMSRYRVVGKLFNNRLIEQWLNGEKIVLKYDYFRQNS